MASEIFMKGMQQCIFGSFILHIQIKTYEQPETEVFNLCKQSHLDHQQACLTCNPRTSPSYHLTPALLPQLLSLGQRTLQARSLKKV